MCGIVGYIGNKNAKNIILEGLKLLEYRGYDSAGIALKENNEITIYKDKGRVNHLEDLVKHIDTANLGIGHTRWATHGKPNQINSHPHTSMSGRFTIVHNGVVENFRAIKSTYLKDYTFKTETDTEVVANLIEELSRKYVMKDILVSLMSILEGSYALLILDNQNLDQIYVLKNKTPILIGYEEKGTVIASDVMPLASYSKKYISLLDKTFAICKPGEVELFDNVGTLMNREWKDMDVKSDEFSKGEFPHYMLKEIYEQPSVIRRLVQNYFIDDDINIDPRLIEAIKKTEKINLVACGTSMYASYMAKYFFEKLCEIPSEVFCASELMYSHPLIVSNSCFIYLSQSGETADSMEVMKKFKKDGHLTIAITNVPTSSMNDLADFSLNMYAGKEIAVASTKAYCAEIVVCAILAKAISNKSTKLKQNLSRVALAIEDVLSKKEVIKDMAKEIYKSNDLFYIGRGIDYWASLEAALKLKEISYIHTEAFSSGELKHGSIALIDEGLPVIAICTQDGTNSIVRNNLEETKSRGAKTFVISKSSFSSYNDSFVINDVAHYLTPLVTIPVCQLLAYYCSSLRGNDVDKPKNLAKSVTVQ